MRYYVLSALTWRSDPVIHILFVSGHNGAGQSLLKLSIGTISR